MSKFVIYTPDHQDYFVGQTDGGAGWNGDILEAHFYRILPQAERAARIIVAQMKKHAEPYKIFIREVKEKNGQWKIKGEIEILPEPDREEYFRQHPEARARISSSPPAEQGTHPVTYVVYQPTKDDYLAGVEDKGDFEKSGWAPHPRDAMTFETFEDAKRKAATLVQVHVYELTVCELHRTDTQCWTKPIEDVFPALADPSLN